MVTILIASQNTSTCYTSKNDWHREDLTAPSSIRFLNDQMRGLNVVPEDKSLLLVMDIRE